MKPKQITGFVRSLPPTLHSSYLSITTKNNSYSILLSLSVCCLSHRIRPTEHSFVHHFIDKSWSNFSKLPRIFSPRAYQYVESTVYIVYLRNLQPHVMEGGSVVRSIKNLIFIFRDYLKEVMCVEYDYLP